MCMIIVASVITANEERKKTVLNFANEIHTENDAILSNVRIKVKQIFFAVLCVCLVFFLVYTEIRNLILPRHSVSRLSSSLIPKRIPCFLVVTCHRIPWIPFDSMLFVFFLLQHLLCVIIWVVLLNIYARYCCGCLFSAFHISYQCKECT